MELDNIIESLKEEETEYFENGDANDYYRYLVSTDFYKSLEKKITDHEELSELEWEALLNRLYLVTCKSMMEEDRVAIVDEVLDVIGRVGMFFSKEDSPLFVECLKMREQIIGMKKLQDINEDLFYGYETVYDTKDETDLDILLKQHRAADAFRGNHNWFVEQYKEENKHGYLTDLERIALNASNRAYEREKELVLKYQV